MDFDQLDSETLARKLSVKWTRDPGAVAAWVADMDFDIAPPIKRAMQQVLDIDDLGYPGYDLRDAVREAFVERMSTRFGWETELEDTWLITTVVQGLHIAITLMSEPGDGVIVQSPIYFPFLDAIEGLDRRMVSAPLGRDGDRYTVDPELIEAAIDESTTVLMLCNPHNPTGRVFTREELEAIGEVALRHDLWVIADEIHQDLLFDDHVHTVFATLSPELAEKTITLTSASKSFNLAGNRCAVIHFGSAELRAKFEAMTHRLFGEVSMMGHVATLVAWTDPDSDAWFSLLMKHLSGNREWLASALAERLPEAVYTKPEGTYLAWVDLSAYGLGEDPAEVLLERGQVALSSGPRFGPGGAGHVRINIATSRSILEEVVERMERVVAETRA